MDGLPHEFVLIYELRHQDAIDTLAAAISKKLGVPIVGLCTTIGSCKARRDVIDIADAGSAEFLFLFRKAQFVVTNSFHGTAFSINFSRPFYSVLERKRGNNSRQLDLLERCGLSNRVAYEGELPQNISLTIDFAMANCALDALRRQSVNYITDAIDG